MPLLNQGFADFLLYLFVSAEPRWQGSYLEPPPGLLAIKSKGCKCWGVSAALGEQFHEDSCLSYCSMKLKSRGKSLLRKSRSTAAI